MVININIKRSVYESTCFHFTAFVIYSSSLAKKLISGNFTSEYKLGRVASFSSYLLAVKQIF